MITKAYLDTGGTLLSRTVMDYDENKEEYVFDIPKGITLDALIRLVEEAKRITEWEE